MKKGFLLLAIVLLCGGMTFAAESESKGIYVTGNIPSGYVDDSTKPDGVIEGEDPVLKLDGVWYYIRIAESGDQNPTYTDSLWQGAKSINGYSSDSDRKSVDITHTDANNGVDSLIVMYGVFASLNDADLAPSVSISISTDGWRPENSGSVVDTISLLLDTAGLTTVQQDGGPQLTGAESGNTLHVARTDGNNATGTINPVQPVGYTVVTWGPAEGKVPVAGDYVADISITIEKN